MNIRQSDHSVFFSFHSGHFSNLSKDRRKKIKWNKKKKTKENCKITIK